MTATKERSRWWSLAAVALLAVTLMTIGFALDPRAAAWDEDAYRADELAQSVRSLFMPLGKAELALTVVFAIGALGLRRRATAAVVALAISGVLVAGLKPAIGRERPNGETGALPSGDAATIAAALTPLVAATPAAWPVAAVAVGGVASFRVLDKMHHPSDVATGAVLGVAAGLAGLLLVRRLRRVPSSRVFLALMGIGVVATIYGAIFGTSERYLTGLVVILPPFLLLVGARWLSACAALRGGIDILARPPVVIVLAVLVLAACWLIADGSTLWDRDEPRFARASVEMLSSGDWMVPTFNDRLRPDKPVGIYWLMANSVRLFGVGEWAVRMWAGVGIATAMLLVAAFVRRRVEGANPGLAAVVLGLAPLAFVVGTAATTDAVLLAATTGAMVVLADGLLDRWTAGRVVLLGVLLGAGLLIKGPVALAVTGLAIGLWVVLTLTTRDTRWRTDLGAYAAAAVIGLAIFLAWAVPANAASGGELARLGLGHHVVNRMQQPLESHGGSLLLYLPYYPLVLLVGLMPWTLYLPGAIAAVWRRSLGEAKVRRLLLSWALPTIVLMTLVATKLPHYVLPVVPALAVVIAIAVPAAIRKPDIATGRWWASGRWIVLVVGLLVAIAIAIGSWWVPVPELRRHLIGLAAIFAVTTLAVVGPHRRGNHTRVLVTFGLAAAIVILQVRMALPVVERVKPGPMIAAAVRAAVPADVPVAAAGFREPSLAFYLDRSFTELGSGEVEGWLDAPGDGVLITEARLLGDERRQLEEIARYEGINISNGRQVVVVAVRR